MLQSSRTSRFLGLAADLQGNENDRSRLLLRLAYAFAAVVLLACLLVASLAAAGHCQANAIPGHG